MICVYFLGFEMLSPQFKNENPFLEYIDKVTDDITEANVIIISSAISPENFIQLINSHAIKILYLSEPIYGFEFSSYTRIIYENNIYDYIIGCINNDIMNNKYKYPFYMDVLKKNKDFTHKTYTSLSKRFCSLISRHDMSGLRTKAFYIMNQYSQVDCPGVLFNNMPNDELEFIGKINFIQKYLFHICFENFGCAHKGYITEKLADCCMGGAIPIYNGILDEIDKKIFNEARIIFVDTNTPFKSKLDNNFKKLDETILFYLNNPDKLLKLYNMKIFEDTAEETIKFLEENLKLLFTNIKSRLNQS